MSEKQGNCLIEDFVFSLCRECISKEIPNKTCFLDVGTWYQSKETSGWYEKAKQAGTVSLIRVEGKMFAPL